MLELTLRLAGAEALRTLFDEQLAMGRVFLADARGATVLTSCVLVVQQGQRTHRLAAEVVFVKEEGPGRGIGLQLAPLDVDAKAALQTFVESVGEPDAEPEPPATEAATQQETTAPEDDAGDEDLATAGPLRERLRTLSAVEQQRIAAGGTLSERIAVERMYGPNVWDTLLRNPRLTIPEVARIGRKGTLPRPLVDAIAANASWLATADVQRALLSNPRSSAAVVTRVLQMLKRAELQLVLQQTAYPAVVRQIAKRMLAR